MPADNALSHLDARRRLKEIIKEKSLKRDKEYVLASGKSSNYYFNMKRTTFDPEGLSLICPIVYDLVSQERGTYIGGLAHGAIPIVSALVTFSATRNPVMGFYVREEIKDHGTQQLIEGFIEDGANVIILDDVTTLGSSVMKAVRAVRDRKCKIVKVITIVDRLEGAAETFSREGLEFVPIFTTKDFD
jgi:orotate phosphoribosyltransferase